MPHHDDHHSRTSAKDPASPTRARRLRDALTRHPVAIGFLGVLVAALIFLLGVRAGEAIYLAVEGDRSMAAGLAAAIVAILAAVIGVRVWLGRR
ncbi:MAG: hypothetical protein JJT89_05680 [Nitriliruptoraceae bacterium]|nr:hypothetical protein [Nitriliruptoraceae bacterium]